MIISKNQLIQLFIAAIISISPMYTQKVLIKKNIIESEQKLN
jgi:hypothetical protein